MPNKNKKLKKYLCLDYGSQNIGVAIGDNQSTISFARTVLKNDSQIFTNLKKIITTEKITHLVVGSPLTGNRDIHLAQFSQKLKQTIKLPVIITNEDYSTCEAEENMQALKLTPQEQKQQKDAFAAQIILQKFLDQK